MDNPTTCPKCGIHRPARSPGGLCPGCMLREGLGDDLSLTYPGTPGATISLVGDTVLAKLSASIGQVPRILLHDTTQGETPSPMVQPSSSEMPDARLDRLQLFGEIARGGMGAILKGRDPDLGRDLAVKVLLERHSDDPDLVRRFIEEAQIAGQLQHPGIVPVYEIGAFADARPYFTMKLVKGRTLAEMLAGRPARVQHKPEAQAKDLPGKPSLARQACGSPDLPKTPSLARQACVIPTADLPRYLAIFEAIAQTMAYAHARGVIHRDLKPSNVMVGSFGEVQVMDWGLAKVLPKGGIVDDAAAGKLPPQETVIATARSGSDDPNLSHPGSIMGTPAYMAPEQARGEEHVAVINVATLMETMQIHTSDGAAIVIFRADGAVAFVNSSRTLELTVVDVKTHAVVKRIVGLVSPFSPNLAASPDGKEVWLTHKDVGKTTIVDAQTFSVLGVIDTGPTTNHVNFVTRTDGDFAYVTVGGENLVKVYRRNGGTPTLIGTIATGDDPHGLWPSPDNSRVYVCLENQDAVQVVDTATRSVIATLKIGQMCQALVYVANAVPSGDGLSGLTQQNVNLRIRSTKLIIAGGGEAEVVMRELQGVDSVDVQAKGLVVGQTYRVFASSASGAQQFIADFKADANGKGQVNPLLKFFDAGLTGVLISVAS